MKAFLLVSCTMALLCGCTSPKSVIATTGTVLGFEVAENPTTQLYHAKLGYARSEVAFVPGNENDLSQVADVVMELRFSNILKGGGVYQRLAVGKTAVTQPGASLMFAKDASGSVSPETAQAILGIPKPDANVTAQKMPLAVAYNHSTNKAAFDVIASNFGFSSFSEFLTKPDVSATIVTQVAAALKAGNLLP